MRTIQGNGIHARKATISRGTARRFCLTLTAVVLQTMLMNGEVLDNFSDPGVTAQRWNWEVLFGQGGYQVTNGQVRVFLTPDGEHGFVTASWKSRQFVVREGRTVELRVDLIGSSGDGAMARVGFAEDYTAQDRANYVLFFDQDTAAVVKRPESRQLLWLTNGPALSTTNVKMVVALTGLPGGSVRVHTKVLDNERGGVPLLDQSFEDTAAADPLGAGTDNPPGSLLGRPCRPWVGLYHDNAGYMDPVPGIGHLEEASVIFDNVELLDYSEPLAEISHAVRISWPEDTMEEQIVVQANSVAADALWSPCPEPLFRASGKIFMAVPAAAQQRFFKLVPGVQFSDDFEQANPPYGTKGEWVPFFLVEADRSHFVFTPTNGAYRISGQSAVDGRVAIKPPGPDIVVGDFSASVDVVDWSPAIPDYSVGIAARGQGSGVTEAGLPNSYTAGVNFRPPGYGAGKALLYIWHGVAPEWHSPVFDVTAGSKYRLEFSGTGSSLTVRLLNLTDPQAPVRELKGNDATFQAGIVGLFARALSGQTYNVTVDNYFVTGTKP